MTRVRAEAARSTSIAAEGTHNFMSRLTRSGESPAGSWQYDGYTERRGI